MNRFAILTNGGDAAGMTPPFEPPRGPRSDGAPKSRRVRRGLIDGDVIPLTAPDAAEVIIYDGAMLVTLRYWDIMTPAKRIHAAATLNRAGIQRLKTAAFLPSRCP